MQRQSHLLWTAAVPSLLVVALAALAVAGNVTGLNPFVPGQVADANQVNANFQAVKTAVDDNNARLTAVENNGAALAAAHIDGGALIVSRSFNNVGGAITVIQPFGPGTYQVNFGFNVSSRYYVAVCGDNIPGNVTNVMLEVGPRSGQPNSLFVEARDHLNNMVDTQFYIIVF